MFLYFYLFSINFTIKYEFFVISQNNIGQSSGPPNLDINILPVWSKGITGRGVVVAILDDGELICISCQRLL